MQQCIMMIILWWVSDNRLFSEISTIIQCDKKEQNRQLDFACQHIPAKRHFCCIFSFVKALNFASFAGGRVWSREQPHCVFAIK